MKPLFHPTLFFLCMLSTRLIAAEIPRDARGLKQGTFSHRDMDQGKQVGASSIAIRLLADGNYEFSNIVTFSEEFSGFHSQRWQTIAAANFAPKSASLDFVGASSSSPVFELHYAARRGAGFLVEQKASAPSVKRLIDDPILDGTVDQSIDWAAAICGSLIPGVRSVFSVYDPATGVSRVIERVGNPEAVKTQAGSFLSPVRPRNSS